MTNPSLLRGIHEATAPQECIFVTGLGPKSLLACQRVQHVWAYVFHLITTVILECNSRFSRSQTCLSFTKFI